MRKAQMFGDRNVYFSNSVRMDRTIQPNEKLVRVIPLYFNGCQTERCGVLVTVVTFTVTDEWTGKVRKQHRNELGRNTHGLNTSKHSFPGAVMEFSTTKLERCL